MARDYNRNRKNPLLALAPKERLKKAKEQGIGFYGSNVGKPPVGSTAARMPSVPATGELYKSRQTQLESGVQGSANVMAAPPPGGDPDWSQNLAAIKTLGGSKMQMGPGGVFSTPSPQAGPGQTYQEAMDAANRANEERYQQGLGLYKQVSEMYKPGGGFGAGQLAAIEGLKRRDVASGMQSLVSSGLAKTTLAATLPQAWETNVGTQARLDLADLQRERYAGSLVGQAGFIERRTDRGPDLGLYAGLTQQAATAPTYRQQPPPTKPTPQPSPGLPQPSPRPIPRLPSEPQPTPRPTRRKEGDTWTKRGPDGQETEYKIVNGKTMFRFRSRNTAGWTPWEEQRFAGPMQPEGLNRFGPGWASGPQQPIN